MMPSNTDLPIAGLTVDIKKTRIRITQKTLQLINNPQHFRVLVNPESKGLIIEGCSENDLGAFHVGKISSHKGYYELCSKSLIREFIYCAGFTGTETIKLKGKQINSQSALLFRLEQPKDCEQAN